MRSLALTPHRDEGEVTTMTDMAEVHESIEVAAPIRQVYAAWTNFTQFPRFMEHVAEVRETGEGRYHWKARGPLGSEVEWDAYVVENIPEELVAWRSDDGDGARVNGAVRFEPLGDRTRIEVNMGYQAPMGMAGEAVVRMFSNPADQTREDLARFKQMIESHAELAGDGELRPSGPPAERGEV